MIDVLAIVIAGALGWCLARAALCGVAAAQQAVLEQRAAALYLQVIALATAGVTLLGLSLWIGDVGRLPGEGGTRLGIVVAATLLAVGMLVNGGCYLGSIMYLGRGKANYLFTLVGITAAAWVDLPGRAGWTVHPSLRPPPSNGILWIAVAGFVALTALAVVGTRREQGRHLDSRLGYTALAGVLAGALMIHLPGWNYGALLNGIAHLQTTPLTVSEVGPPLALFAGAVASCIAAGTWQPAAPTALGAARCLLGGFIMDTAARAIPGGNDALLLWTMPGLGGYALLAYSVLVSVLLLAFAAQRRFLPAA